MSGWFAYGGHVKETVTEKYDANVPLKRRFKTLVKILCWSVIMTML
jgi:hypothetical protein